MTPISDTNDLPPLRLRMRQQFATHQHESLGEVLHIVRTRIARELAEKILCEQKFFELNVDKGYGTMRTDIIVMTQQEYADFAREKFKQGLQHAADGLRLANAIRALKDSVVKESLTVQITDSAKIRAAFEGDYEGTPV